MTDMAFSPGALETNRAGLLSPGQLSDLRAGQRQRSKGLAGRVFRAGDKFAEDVASGRVESAEGAITKRIWQIGGGYRTYVPPSFQILVASRQAGNQQFTTSQDLYDRAPDNGLVRLFFLPRSRWVVNFEVLPDAPPHEGGLTEMTRQALLDWRAAQQAHDAVGEAQARAGMAAIERELASYLPAEVPTAGGQLAPGQLREAIIGDWQSPFLIISIRSDGTVTATRTGGRARAGHWSLDPAGHVITDVMGGPLVFDASVADGELTLTANGQALRLRRSPA